MTHRLTAGMLQQIINEEVQLHRLRRTIRETVECVLLEQASLQDLDEGAWDKLKGAVKTGASIGAILAGFIGMHGDLEARGEEAKITMDLAANQENYDEEELKVRIQKLIDANPENAQNVGDAIKEYASGFFTGSWNSVGHYSLSDRDRDTKMYAQGAGRLQSLMGKDEDIRKTFAGKRAGIFYGALEKAVANKDAAELAQLWLAVAPGDAAKAAAREMK